MLKKLYTVPQTDTELSGIRFAFVKCDTYDFVVFHEETTDVLYLSRLEGNELSSFLTAMLDPKTGLPLTYTVWKEQYDKSIASSPASAPGGVYDAT